MVSRRRIIIYLVGALLLVLPLQAQENTTRDPLALAQRFLNAPHTPVIPEITPLYQLGDTQTFWVPKKGSPTPSKITAVLAGATSNINLWVEEGIPYDLLSMESAAQQIAGLWDTYTNAGFLGKLRGFEQRLSVPDVDNNGILSIVFATQLDDERDALYNPNNSLLPVFVPGGYSNQNDMILVNVSKYPTIAVTDPFYFSILSRMFYQVIANTFTPTQASWLTDALSIYFANQVLSAGGGTGPAMTYLQTGSGALTRLATTAGDLGIQQLFLSYLQQRLGANLFIQLFNAPGEALAPIDAVLTRSQPLDSLTQEPITAHDLFADFVLANIINYTYGDGRYAHASGAPITQGAVAVVNTSIGDLSQLPTGGISQLKTDSGVQPVVEQYGSYYLHMSTARTIVFTLEFNGAPFVQLLPLPEDSARANHFYWSGRDRNRSHTMTRAFDLRGTASAVLSFDAWYDLAKQWHYAYVEVSADNGRTWQFLPATHTTENNAHGLAYGVGFTGISSIEAIRFFPYLGINFDPASGTITGIDPNGPISQTPARIGDTIIGYDGQVWANNQVDLVGLLANYAPGDEINLYMLRDNERFDLPVVLGIHPTRTIIPKPVWLPQQVDLSAYAGQQILLRFEYISLPDMENDGIAIDNIRIPEIGFKDDAETAASDWTLAGWQRVNNQIPQRFIVQSVVLNAQQIPVRAQQLIGPNDDSINGQWRFKLDGNEHLLLAISGITAEASGPALFDITLTRES